MTVGTVLNSIYIIQMALNIFIDAFLIESGDVNSF